jgi:uncharacterized membrane protein YgcG
MKVKGIAAWEQYVEHVIVGIAIVVFLWFGWKTYTDKVEVKVGKETLTAETIDEKLIDRADRIARGISDNANPRMDLQEPKPILQRYRDGRAASLSPKDRLLFPTLDLTADLSVNRDIVAELHLYHQPEIPAPQSVTPRQWFGTIAPQIIEETDALASLITGPPHDIGWIQIAAQFDLQNVIDVFAMGDEGTRPVPPQWYNDQIDVLDVRMERQVLGGDGSWLPPQVVGAMPDRLSYRKEIADGEIDAGRRNAILAELRARDRQVEITNPAFYALKGIEPPTMTDPDAWLGIGDEEDAEDDPLSKLRRELRQLDSTLRRFADQIRAIERSIAREQESGAGGGGSFGVGGGGSGGSSSGGSSKLEKLRQSLVRLKEQEVEARDRREEIVAELIALDEEAASEISGWSDGQLWIWGHDLDVEPGATYRYRCVVDVANPFFARKPSLYPEQHGLADQVKLASLPSDWSDAIEAQPPLQWFLLRGYPADATSRRAGDLDAGRVSAEVYRFTDGRWSKESVQVSAGQLLAAGSAFETEWFVLDLLPWLDSGEAERRADRGDWVLLQNLRTGEVRSVAPWEQAGSARLQELQEQAIEGQPIEDEGVADAGDDSGPPGMGGGR